MSIPASASGGSGAATAKKMQAGFVGKLQVLRSGAMLLRSADGITYKVQNTLPPLEFFFFPFLFILFIFLIHSV